MTPRTSKLRPPWSNGFQWSGPTLERKLDWFRGTTHVYLHEHDVSTLWNSSFTWQVIRCIILAMYYGRLGEVATRLLRSRRRPLLFPFSMQQFFSHIDVIGFVGFSLQWSFVGSTNRVSCSTTTLRIPIHSRPLFYTQFWAILLPPFQYTSQKVLRTSFLRHQFLLSIQGYSCASLQHTAVL